MFAMLLVGASPLLMAQTKNVSLIKADTIKIGKQKPVQADEITEGQLFNVSRQRSTGAVSTVSGKTLYNTPTANITNTLNGVLPGLTVLQGSGEPGYDVSGLYIRGIGTYGVNNYKIYVDGFEVDNNYFNYMVPAEIESISILKDAASLATFGMEGANGIVWVVTKRGHIGKSTLTFQTRSGQQSPITLYKPLNSYGYANLYNEAISNDNGMVWTPKYSPAQLQAYQNGTGTNVDWFNQVVKNHGAYTDGDLAFNGGDENAKYNIVFDYANQQGLYNTANSPVTSTVQTSNEQFKRYNLRTDLDFKLFNIFDAKVDIGGRVEQRRAPNYTVAYNNFSTASIWNNLENYPSNIYPVFDTTGTNGLNTHYSGTTVYPNNPVASIHALGWVQNINRELLGNFSLREKLDFITKGLYLKEAYSYNSFDQTKYAKTATYARYINGTTTTTDKTTSIVAVPDSAYAQEDLRQGQISLGYDRSFGEHSIISAVSYQSYSYLGEGLYNYNINHENISGKFNYAYRSRYIAEFGFSYYGSDAYAPGHQWGFYPAISGAWIISNESFLKNKTVVNFWKLRVSVGKSGNSDGLSPSNFATNGRYLYQQYYSGTSSLYLGTTTPTGSQATLNPLFIANPNAFAEASLKYNVGTDLVLFKNLNISADVFEDKRSGISTQLNNIPGYFGNQVIFENVGKMTNKGFELSSSYVGHITKKLGYTLNGMASYAKNIINYESEIPPAYSYNAQTGRSYGTPIGLKSNGFYQTTDFNANGTLVSGEAVPEFGAVQPGDIKYKDLDHNGIVDQNDVTAVGKPSIPTLTYAFGGSLNFKSFDFSILFQGAGGNSVNLLNVPGMQGFVNNGNAFPIQQGAWAYYPSQGIDTRATATYPRLTTLANNNNYRTSDFWMRSGDYLRIRNAEIGYDFASMVPKSFTKLRFYVNAMNPVTWSALLRNYKIDPQTISGYPALKSYNVGVVAVFK